MNSLRNWFLAWFDPRGRALNALLREIIANPDDDGLRLAFAEMLAKTGKPDDAIRADFIRMQLENAQLPEGFDRSRRIEQAVKIFHGHQNQWYGWVRSRDNIPFPQRGFIESWFCGKGDIHHADFLDAFAREPITELTLAPGDDKLAMISRLPLLSRVRVLKLWADRPAESDLLTFFSSPNVTRLTSFEFMGPGWLSGKTAPARFQKVMGILANDPRFADLRGLTIASAHVGDEGAIALARSSTLTALTGIGLTYCEIGAHGMRELLGSPLLAKVSGIGLGGNALTQQVGEDLADSIASSPYLGQISSLSLDHTAHSDQAAARLASANLPSLKQLFLVPRNVNDHECPALLPAMSATGLESLVSSKWFGGLEVLNLSSHPIGDAGARALAAARLPRLRHLTLMQVGLTSGGLKDLVDAYSNQLQHLQLYGNPIGDAGAEILASVPWPQMVSQPGKSDYEIGLFLGGCGLSKRGMDILLESRTTRLIPSLFLGSD